MELRTSLLLFLVFLLSNWLVPHASSASQAQAQAPALSGFEDANRLYEAGRYREAAAAYQALLRSNHLSVPLLYNLGNAEFKSGQFGRAIAAYRKAERLAPRDPDIRANLQFACNQVQGPRATPTLIQRWLARLTLNEWAGLAAAALWLFFLLLAAYYWRPAWKRPLRPWQLASGILALILAACLGAAYSTAARPMAIVLHSDAEIHQGPFEESPVAFKANDGSELLILDEKDDWLRVSDGNKRAGWIPRSGVTLAP